MGAPQIFLRYGSENCFDMCSCIALTDYSESLQSLSEESSEGSSNMIQRLFGCSSGDTSLGLSITQQTLFGYLHIAFRASQKFSPTAAQGRGAQALLFAEHSSDVFNSCSCFLCACHKISAGAIFSFLQFLVPPLGLLM